MASDWSIYPISDFVTLSQGLAINAKSKYLLEETGLPLLRITDLINGTQVHFVNEEKAPPKCIATDHELIYTRTGQVGLVYRNKVGVVHNNCFKVIPSPEMDKDFLYWFLFQESTKAHVNAVASGSVQKDLNHAAFLTLEIPKPKLSEQKAIASILDSLDDKIELNRQMNETLEAMAQALFKSWFVDFDPVIDNALAAGNAIPDEFSERAEQRKAIEKKDNSDIQNLFPDEFEFTEEMGWIPKGWEVGRYSDLAELNPQSWNKKSMPEEISYVDLGNTNNGKIDLVVSYSSSEAPSRAKRVLSTDDTIIGTVRPGNRSFAFIHNEGLTGSTGFAVMKPIESINRTYIYLGLTQSIVIDYFAHIADGGAYPAINPSVVADLECIIPPSEVLEKFDNLAYRFMKKNGENNNHNETLAKLRDTLLSKLMSGELRIPDDILQRA